MLLKGFSRRISHVDCLPRKLKMSGHEVQKITYYCIRESIKPRYIVLWFHFFLFVFKSAIAFSLSCYHADVCSDVKLNSFTRSRFLSTEGLQWNGARQKRSGAESKYLLEVGSGRQKICDDFSSRENIVRVRDVPFVLCKPIRVTGWLRLQREDRKIRSIVRRRWMNNFFLLNRSEIKKYTHAHSGDVNYA